jgi:hypothetical protein
LHFTAEEFARQTLALLVGVGRYQKSGLRELAAVEDVIRLREALIDGAACGIPCRNVTHLANEDASLGQVTAELRLLAERCTAESMLFVYVAGHGHRQDNTFAFHLFDTDPAAPTATGLTATRLTESLEGCKARGVLVVADCCVGAGFAETAPPFFFELGQHEFRLAVSASRKNQRSWEVPDEGGSLFCRHFVDILQGMTAAGIRPGEITYLGLVEGLRFALEEDLAQRGEGFPRQEIVANGSLISDPVLFVSARGAMKGLTVETGRVTRQYLRRVLMRWGIGLSVALLMAAGLYSGWMGSHEFAVADSSGTSLYRGLPGWTGFGYPIPILRLSLDADSFSPTCPLGQRGAREGNAALVVLGSGRILSVLEQELHPVERAWRLANVGRRKEALGLLKAIRGGNTRLSGTHGILAASLRLRLAPRNWVDRLERSASRTGIEERHNALLALLELEPRSAFRVLEENTHWDASFQQDHHEVLLNLEPPCSDLEAAYLRLLVKSPELHNVLPVLLLTWRRLGCAVTDEDVLTLADQPSASVVEQVGTWAMLQGFGQPDAILGSPKLDIEQLAAFAVGWGQVACHEDWFLRAASAGPRSKALVLRHAAMACPGAEVETHASSTSLRMTLRAPRSSAPALSLELSDLGTFNRPRGDQGFLQAFQLLEDRRVREAEPFLMQQLLDGDLATVATAALRAARALGLPWQPGQGFLRGENDAGFALQYYLWLRQADAKEADRIARERVLEERFSYFFDYAALTGSSLLSLESLRDRVHGESTPEGVSAARLVAMFGAAEDLEELGAHPDPAVRQALVTHAAFNPATRAWLQRPRPEWFDLLVYRPALERAAHQVASLEREFENLDRQGRCLILGFELEKRSLRGGLGQREHLPEGVRLWLNKEAADC